MDKNILDFDDIVKEALNKRKEIKDLIKIFMDEIKANQSSDKSEYRNFRNKASLSAHVLAEKVRGIVELHKLDNDILKLALSAIEKKKKIEMSDSSNENKKSLSPSVIKLMIEKNKKELVD